MSNDSNNAFGENPTQPFGPGDGSAHMLGRYRLLRILGEGTFGVVWLAEERGEVTRRVAIKILKNPKHCEEIAARFRQEIQAQAMMNHPGIAKILAVDRTPDGRPYYVMEYIRGLPLTSFCDQLELSIKDRLVLFRRVCDAVQHAHMRGVIHRDLKPSNILAGLVDDAERFSSVEQVFIRVIDFGVARAIHRPLIDDTIDTLTQQPIGTLGYMSPEQAYPGPLGIDTRADVYSLGIVLYELLAGARPFTNQQIDQERGRGVRDFLEKTEPPPPSTRLSNLIRSGTEEGRDPTQIARARRSALESLVAELRRELEWIPLRAVSAFPDDRYRSPADLSDDIARYLEGKPLLAGPRTLWYHARKIARLYRAQAAVALTIIALLIGGSAAVTWQWREAESARALAVQQKAEVERQAYRALILAAEGAIARRDYRGGAKLLAEADPTLVGWEHSTLARFVPPLPRQVFSVDPAIMLRAEGSRLTAVGLRQSFECDALTFAPAGTPGDVRTPIAMASNGLHGLAYFIKDRRWKGVDLTGNASIDLNVPTSQTWNIAAASGTGERFALGVREKGPVLLLARDGPPIREITAPASTLQFTPDGTRLVLGDTTLTAIDAKTGSTIGPLLPTRQGAAPRVVRFAPDASLVLVCDQELAELWDLTSATLRWRLVERVREARFLSAGRGIVLAGQRRIFVVSPDAPARRRSFALEFPVVGAGEIIGDGRIFAAGELVSDGQDPLSNPLAILDVPDLAPLALSLGADALLGSPKLDRLLLGSARSGSWSILDTKSRSLVSPITGALGAPSWSIDGSSALLAAASNGTPTLFRCSANAWEPVAPLPIEATTSDHVQPRVGVKESVAGGIYALVVTNRDQSLHIRAGDTWRRVGSWPIFAGNPDQQALDEAVRPALLAVRSDANAIAAALEREIVLVDPATGAATAFPFQAVPEMLEFAPNGQWLAAAGAAGVIHLINTETRTVVVLQSAMHRGTDERIVSLYWAANDRLVSVSNRELVVWDTNRLSDVMRTAVQSPVAGTGVGPDRRPVMLYADGSVEWLEDRR